MISVHRDPQDRGGAIRDASLGPPLTAPITHARLPMAVSHQPLAAGGALLILAMLPDGRVRPETETGR